MSAPAIAPPPVEAPGGIDWSPLDVLLKETFGQEGRGDELAVTLPYTLLDEPGIDRQREREILMSWQEGLSGVGLMAVMLDRDRPGMVEATEAIEASPGLLVVTGMVDEPPGQHLNLRPGMFGNMIRAAQLRKPVLLQRDPSHDQPEVASAVSRVRTVRRNWSVLEPTGQLIQVRERLFGNE